MSFLRSKQSRWSTMRAKKCIRARLKTLKKRLCHLRADLEKRKRTLRRNCKKNAILFRDKLPRSRISTLRLATFVSERMNMRIRSRICGPIKRKSLSSTRKIFSQFMKTIVVSLRPPLSTKLVSICINKTGKRQLRLSGQPARKCLN